MVLAWKNVQKVFVVVDLQFIFVSSFWCCSSSVDVLHSHLLFDVISHPSVDYHQVFTLILYFQPNLLQSDSQHFRFQPFRYLLAVGATVLSEHFLPTGVFCLALPHQHFACVYQGLRGGWELYLKVCKAYSFETLVPCSKSYVKTIKKHFEQD